MALQFNTITSLADFRLLENFAREIWEEHYIPIIGSKQVAYMMEKFQKAEVMHHQAEEGGYEFCFVLSEGSLAGYIAFSTRVEEMFLSKFYLEKSCRGKGWAREMLRFLEKLAKRESLKRIVLTVNKYNTGSISAYQALGFNILEPVVIDIGGGFIMDDYRMEKHIAEV